MQAQIESLKIKLFDFSGGITMYVQTFSEMLIPLAQIIPLFTGVTKAVISLGTAVKMLKPVFIAVKVFSINACRAIGEAIINIPIVGWVATAIVALAALFAYFWKTSAKFRAVIKGSWAFTLSILKESWNTIKKYSLP